jgi:Family of unknown function (DUF6212)
MTVYAPATALPRLYDGSVKAVAIGASAELGERIPALVLHAHRDAANGALHLGIARNAENEWVPLEVPPANVWFIWAADETRLPDAMALLKWWQMAGGETTLPPLWTDSADSLSMRMLDLALGEIHRLHKRNQELQRNLSQLREDWAHSVRIPPEVIELLDNLRLSRARMMFGRMPGSHAIPVPTLLGSEPSLVQRLPAWARGLAGFDLHLAKAGTDGGFLIISLHAADADRGLAHWRIPFLLLRPGWLPLRLSTASSLPYRDLELRISCVSDDGRPPSLSLAPAGLLNEFALQGDDMLALRLWCGLPGIAYQSDSNLPLHPLPARISVPIGDQVVALVRPTREYKAPIVWCRLLKGGKVLLHPLSRLTVAAVIPLQALPCLTAVTCEAGIGDQRCHSAIACKLVAAAPEITADQAERDEGVLGSSGWVVIDMPKSPHVLTADFSASHEGPVQLHLFSKMADTSGGDYGWLVFRDFVAELDAHASGAMPVSLPRSDEPYDQS